MRSFLGVVCDSAEDATEAIQGNCTGCDSKQGFGGVAARSPFRLGSARSSQVSYCLGRALFQSPLYDVVEIGIAMRMSFLTILHGRSINAEIGFSREIRIDGIEIHRKPHEDRVMHGGEASLEYVMTQGVENQVSTRAIVILSADGPKRVGSSGWILGSLGPSLTNEQDEDRS